MPVPENPLRHRQIHPYRLFIVGIAVVCLTSEELRTFHLSKPNVALRKITMHLRRICCQLYWIEIKSSSIHDMIAFYCVDFQLNFIGVVRERKQLYLSSVNHIFCFEHRTRQVRKGRLTFLESKVDFSIVGA